MAEFAIADSDLTPLKGKVVLLTGCSSGIGLATTKLLLELGASVVGGDMNPVPIEHPALTFSALDVTSWANLSALFKIANDSHGRIDHVFANAGIGPRTNYLDEKLDEAGNLLEPDHRVIDVNLRSVINTTALAVHYLRKQESGGSIVLTASGSSFQRFRFTDYTTAKHGVLGIMRGMVPNFESDLPIRINAIGPSWTATGLVPKELTDATGIPVQSPSVVARAVAVLMADDKRQGEFIYSFEGRHKEIENALLLKASATLNEPGKDEDSYGKKFRDAIMRTAAASAPSSAAVGQ